MPLQILFLDLLYLHQLIKYPCRCFFLLICKNMQLQLAFSLSCRYSLQKFASATCFFSILQILPCKKAHPQTTFSLSCRYSPHKICIHNLLFLYLQILPCKNMHPQLAFSLLADTPLLQYTFLFNLLWIFTEFLF